MTGPARRPVAIINVTVHTMDTRRTVKGQTVVIEDGRVSRMGRVGEVPTAGFDIVDGTGDLVFARADHTATLPDGRVLLVGGYTGTGYQMDGSGSRQRVMNPDPDFVAQFVAEAEIWNPATGFEAAGTLTTGPTGHSATALNDGRVAIIGGFTGLEQEGGVYLEMLDSVEIWDAATESFRGGPQLTEARAEHSAIAMADGSVLILGGGTVLEELTSVVVWRDEPNSDD